MSLASPSQAQAPSSPPVAAFSLDIEAPKAIREYLQRHLELQRYRELTDLSTQELERLVAAAERNAQELLATLGYFSPEVRISLGEAAAGAPRPVKLLVVPGEVARVSEVQLEFAGAIRDEDAASEQRLTIQSSWALRSGEPFSQAAWDDAKAQALRQLTTERYPAGTLRDSQAEVDPDTHSVRLRLTLDSGPVYSLGPLVPRGLQRHDTELVTRLARLPPGSPYSQARLLEAQQRLSDSGFFDSVFLSLDLSGDPAAAPVIVQLREARLQKLVLGLGISTDSGARATAEHTHHRLPGLGWRAVTKLSLDRETRSIGAELTSPPDERHWRWLTSALFQQQRSGSFDVRSQRWRAGRTQSGERIDRSYYLQYDRARTTGAGSSTLADALSANYAWTRRNFDSLPFPTRGYGLGLELGGGLTLGGDRQPYGRTLARWRGYWPLAFGEGSQQPPARSDRLALRADAGAVFARTGAVLPTTQLFLTGGDTSVRGYGFRDIGVTRPGGQTAAGRYLVVGSVEWQHPISVDGRPSDWETALFLDAGAVADKPGELRAKTGVGAGLRWKSPVGPLQIDLAYGVAVKRLRLHLSVGFNF